VRRRQRGQENGELTTVLRRCMSARDINQNSHVRILEISAEDPGSGIQR
jgi:hypothetical protein